MTHVTHARHRRHGHKAPGLDDIERMACQALDTVPEEFTRYLGDIVFRVDEFPPDDVLDELGLESPFELMGLYQGVDLARKSVADPAGEPDMIFLYRRPILDYWCETGGRGRSCRARRPILDYWCETGEDLALLVRHVVIHEIGHHFGLSDEDMEAIEAEA